MILMRHILVLGTVLVVAPAAMLPAWTSSAAAEHPAGARTAGGPVAPISELYATLAAIEHQGASTPFEQRAQSLAPVIDRAFNMPTILHTSVGPRYDTLPPAQRQQLEQVFRQFTIARYVSNFSSNSGDTFKVLPQARPSPYGSDQIVQTELTSKDGTVTKVDYVMRHFGEGWQAVDVLLAGHISQVAVQRSDFASTVSTGDASPLIASLKKKIQSFSGT